MQTSSKTLLLVALICAVAVGLRLRDGAQAGPAAGWPALQVVNLDIAANLAAGHGYVNTIGMPLADTGEPDDRPIAWDQIRRDGVPAERPIEYYLPGYPLLLTPFVSTFGPSYTVAQSVNAVVDGILGPTLVYLLLATFGFRPAGLLAAALYATADPLRWQTALVLPDALSFVLTLAPCVAIARALRADRPLAWLFFGGLLLGLGCWFRGEVVALAVILTVVAAMCLPRQRRLMAPAVLAGWLAIVMLLGVFWQQEYGYMTLSRPGVGSRLWVGIGGLNDNPWGIQPRDEALADMLTANGYRYGTGSGDAFALGVALDDLRESPPFLLKMILYRSLRALSTGFSPFEQPEILKIIGEVAFAVGVPFGMLRVLRTDARLGFLIAAMWVARVMPFSILHADPRDLVPLFLPYMLCVAICAVSFVQLAGSLLESRGRALAAPMFRGT